MFDYGRYTPCSDTPKFPNPLNPCLIQQTPLLGLLRGDLLPGQQMRRGAAAANDPGKEIAGAQFTSCEGHRMGWIHWARYVGVCGMVSELRTSFGPKIDFWWCVSSSSSQLISFSYDSMGHGIWHIIKPTYTKIADVPVSWHFFHLLSLVSSVLLGHRCPRLALRHSGKNLVTVWTIYTIWRVYSWKTWNLN